MPRVAVPGSAPSSCTRDSEPGAPSSARAYCQTPCAARNRHQASSASVRRIKLAPRGCANWATLPRNAPEASSPAMSAVRSKAIVSSCTVYSSKGKIWEGIRLSKANSG